MGLRRYIGKRIAIGLLTLFVVMNLNFWIFVLHPGDPTHFLLDATMPPEQKEMMREMYGVDEPLHVQYIKYMKNLASFGVLPPYFGFSHKSHEYVAEEMSLRLPFTVAFLGLALVGSVIVGIPLGIFTASKRGSKTDVTIMGISLFTYGVPTFFIQLFALFFFVSLVYQKFGFHLFPRSGWGSYPPPEGTLPFLADIAWHMALPVLTLIASSFVYWALYTRNMLLDILTQDYILTARAKGLRERTVLLKHAFRSIYPQVATMITLSIPSLMTGSILTETVFGLQGIGKWYIDSISIPSPDYPVVQAVIFIFAVLVILLNFIADLLYGIFDPRIRVGTRK